MNMMPLFVANDFKKALHTAVDNLDTVGLDNLLAEDTPDFLLTKEELRVLTRMLVLPSADKYDHQADKILYCLRVLLDDPRFPSMLATNDNGWHGSVTHEILSDFLRMDQLRMDILQTWLECDPLGSRIADRIPYYFDWDELYTKNCTIMRQSWFLRVLDVNKTDIYGRTLVHNAVRRQSPCNLRVLFEAPNVQADRYGGDSMTPLNLAHHKCIDLLALYESRDGVELTDDEWTDDGGWETYDSEWEDDHVMKVPVHTFKFAETLYEYSEEDSYYQFDLKDEKDKMVEMVRLLLRRDDVDMHKADVRRQD